MEGSPHHVRRDDQEQLLPESTGAPAEDGISDDVKGSTRPCLPHRFRLFLILISGYALHMSNRGNFNIALVAMVKNAASDGLNVSTTDRCEGVAPYNASSQGDGEFSWTVTEQSQLLAAYFYGYAALQIPGGYITERWGSRRVVTVAMGMAGVLNLLMPLLARTSFAALMAARVILGLMGGPVYVATIALWAKWAPKPEVTFLVGGSLAGFQLGNVISFTTTGTLCHSDFLGGWPSVFYIYGSLHIIWVLFWAVFVVDSPNKDKSISIQERVYIEENTDNRDQKKYHNPPLRKIFTSPPVLGFFTMGVTDAFGFYIILNTGAIYMKQMLGMNIQDNGLVLGLQYAGCLLTSIIVSPLSDVIRDRGILSTKNVRKVNTAIGELSLTVTLLLIALVFGCNAMAVVVLLIVGQLFYSFQTCGFIINAVDIAPMYAGTITGISNTMAQFMGFVTPEFVGVMTGDSPGVTEWRRVFLITSGILIFGVIVYSACAGGEELPWAAAGGESEEEEEEEEGAGESPRESLYTSGHLVIN